MSCDTTSEKLPSDSQGNFHFLCHSGLGVVTWKVRNSGVCDTTNEISGSPRLYIRPGLLWLQFDGR